MCGINGLVTKNISFKNTATVAEMNACIVHRGPDDHGVYSDSSGTCQLSMGMQRLAVIDVASGRQPMISQDGDFVIVFNGEIFNYQQLRSELKDSGAIFTTHSDTEVILKLYEFYGSSSFSRLDGMYAFSIYDKKKNKIILARDFFGEKPLYYYYTDTQLSWASELKSLLLTVPEKPAICNQGLNLFLRLTYIPAPYTIYDKVFKLEPDSCLEFDLAKWQYHISSISEKNPILHQPTKISFAEAKRKTKELVTESVNSRMVSDVPVGAFLSGGVDSSIVSLLMSQHSSGKIDTFSVGFQKKSFDESEKARTVAKLISSRHHEFVLSPSDLAESLHKIILNFDEPFADSSALPSYFVAQKTRNHMTVALTGDGGDEMYGGYNKYLIGRLNNTITQILPQSVFNLVHSFSRKVLTTRDDNRGLKFKLAKTINSVDYGDDSFYNIISLGFDHPATSDVLLKKHTVSDVLEYYKHKLNNRARTLHDFRQIDKLISLEGDMLVKVDRTSMLASLECRAPFLNKSIWDFNNTLPEQYLLKGSNKKYLLKETFKEAFPAGFLDLQKQGFGVPVGDWLRTTLKDELLTYCNTSFLEEQNIFNADYIKPIVDSHISAKVDSTFKVWTFYCFQKWYVNIYQQLNV